MENQRLGDTVPFEQVTYVIRDRPDVVWESDCRNGRISSTILPNRDSSVADHPTYAQRLFTLDFFAGLVLLALVAAGGGFCGVNS